jgi:HlyD family secretion protein
VKKAVVIVILALLVAAIGGFFAVQRDWLSFASTRSNGPAAGPGSDHNDSAGSSQLTNNAVHAIGRLEPTRGVITVGGLVGDRIQKLHVKEGDAVEQGQVLAELASRTLRLLEQEALKAQIAEAESRRTAEAAAADSRIQVAEVNLKKARANQAELAAQQKQVTLAESNLELAKRDLQRYEGLPGALVSKQELERQRLLVNKAEAELAAATAALDRLTESAPLAEAAALAELKAAQAAKEAALSAIPVESLQKKLEAAEIQTQETLITAPIAGTVLRIFTREGELIAGKPILQLADLNRLICVAEVFEGDLPRIRVGQRAKVSSGAFPADQPEAVGVVSRMGNMIATPELRSLDPFAPTDRHVVEVEIAFQAGAIPDAARLTNLQVDVTIDASDDPSRNENSAGVAQSRP